CRAAPAAATPTNSPPSPRRTPACRPPTDRSASGARAAAPPSPRRRPSPVRRPPPPAARRKYPASPASGAPGRYPTASPQRASTSLLPKHALCHQGGPAAPRTRMLRCPDNVGRKSLRVNNVKLDRVFGILGAGASGLSLALLSDRDYLIIE